MKYSVHEERGLFVLKSGKNVVKTPSGNILASKHPALMKELVSDANIWGTDPTSQTSMVSLQSSYLDFGLRFPKADMLNDFLNGWGKDIFFQRSADPELMMLQISLYGPFQQVDGELVDTVKSFNLRQLMASIVGKMNMGSAVVTSMVVADIRGVYESSRGLCARYVKHHIQRILKDTGGFLFGGNPAEQLYTPEKYDEKLCKECLQDNDSLTEEMYKNRCEVTIVLDKIKRFSCISEDQ